jgi:Uma2 family endonuclease
VRELDLPADGVITRKVFEGLPPAPRSWAWELHEGRLELVYMPVSHWHWKIMATVLAWWESRGHQVSGEQYIADSGFLSGGRGRSNYVADGLVFVREFTPRASDTTYPAEVLHAVIEAVSSGSEERDANDKFGAYAGLGIPNYWVIRNGPTASPDDERIDGMITMYELRDGAYLTAGHKLVSNLS